MDHSGDTNPVVRRPIEDEISLVRKHSYVVAEFGSRAPHERLFSEFLGNGVKLFNKVIGGIDIDGGDLDPNVCKVSLGEFRVDRIPQGVRALSAASLARPAFLIRSTASSSNGRDCPTSSWRRPASTSVRR